MSVVAIERIEGLVVHVRNLDVLDGTPVLDLKPYVAYADAYPHARAGWLAPSDPRAAWHVAFTPDAEAQLVWLGDRGVDLRPRVEAVLALGPQPHAYRRIRRHAGGGLRLATQDWRVDFRVDERTLLVTGVATGYRERQLATGEAPEVHRAFAAAFARR